MTSSLPMTWVNGTPSTLIDVSDRGLAYGDGVFETMRIVYDAEQQQVVVPLLEWHLKRFSEGVKRLKLGSVDELCIRFKKSLSSALNSIAHDAVCKIIVTRGSGGRGYTPAENVEIHMITQLLTAPEYPNYYGSEGVAVKCCTHRLPSQSALAGIKHLNRLDQVLASQELGAEQEGLLFDQDDNLIEGIKSNVLVFSGAEVFTPSIIACGVRGTLRDFLISNSQTLGIQISERIIDRKMLAQSDGLAMINSVLGIWPVRELDGQKFEIHPNCNVIGDYLKQQLSY